MYVTKHKPNADVFYIFTNNPPICDVAVSKGLYGEIMLGSVFFFHLFLNSFNHKLNIGKLIKF